MCLKTLPPQATKIEKLFNRWRGVSTHTAARLLIKLGCGDDVIDWGRPEKSPLEVFNSAWYKHTHACNIRGIRFFGGPPGKRKLFHGTLLTFFIDRLLYHEAVQ